MRQRGGEETELRGAPRTQFDPSQGLDSGHGERRGLSSSEIQYSVQLNEHSLRETPRGFRIWIQANLRGQAHSRPQLTPRTSVQCQCEALWAYCVLG